MDIIKGIKEIYQRLIISKTPLIFKRIIYACIAVLAAPEVLEVVTLAINTPELYPDFMTTEIFKRIRFMCIGAGIVAKLPVHWGKTNPADIPDVNPPLPVIINDTNVTEFENGN